MVDGSEPEKSEEENEFLTYAKRLGKPRRQLLKAFLAIDRSVVNTADLREETEADEEETSVSEGSILHHLERLDTWGLVEEQPEREYHGRGGRDARTWKLTERGREFCDEYIDAPIRSSVTPKDVAELSQRVDEIEDNLKDVKGIMMQLGVHTDMITKERAREEMDEEWFQDVFEG